MSIDSARIKVTCLRPVEYQSEFFACEDSIVSFFRSFDTISNQVGVVEVYGARWLTASTLSRELKRFRRIEAIGLSRMSTAAMDSVLRGLPFPDSITSVLLTKTDSGPPPASMFRFRNIESAWLEFSDPNIICRALRQWQAIENLTYIGAARDIKCACERQRRLLYGEISDTAGLDYDFVFVTTGMYSYFSTVYSLMPASWKLKQGIIPVVGTREYTIIHHGESRATISQGIMDRFLAVLVARAQAREIIFDASDAMVNKRFLEAVALSAVGATTVRFDVDSIVLFDEFVYRGPFVAIMRRLLDEGCI
jgi:hypothetical protein